jgi:hypothetical protein
MPELMGLWAASPLTIMSSSPQAMRIPDALAGFHFRSLKKILTAAAETGGSS